MDNFAIDCLRQKGVQSQLLFNLNLLLLEKTGQVFLDFSLLLNRLVNLFGEQSVSLLEFGFVFEIKQVVFVNHDLRVCYLVIVRLLKCHH